MDKKIHIILTGEVGGIRSFALSKPGLKTTLLVVALIFCLTCLAGIFFSAANVGLRYRVASLESDLNAATSKNQSLLARVSELEYNVEEPLKEAVSELSQRSKLIESILDSVGIKVRTGEGAGNSGGPFSKLSDDSYDDLIYKVDRYLETVSPMPLGYPVAGVITSDFGRRIDPFNHKPAMHEGIDIRNRVGKMVMATAAGVVETETYDPAYGRYVIIDHQNGFKTLYGHNKKVLVKPGDIIKRGQAISLLGNTGRSSGPHVHYELRYKDKAINPLKFMQVAKYIPRD